MRATREEIEDYRKRWQIDRPNIPYGYCWCGCGVLTKKAQQTSRSKDLWKNEPTRWRLGHNVVKATQLTPEQYRKEWSKKAPSIPYGHCWCGCGHLTPISGQSRLKRRVVKGQPERYLTGHANRRPRMISVENRGFATPCHIWKGSNSGVAGRQYGTIKIGSKTKKAHRVLYEENKGPIPPKHEIHHMCNQTLCVNPVHLKALTKAGHFKTHVEGFSASGLRTRWRNK